MSRLYFGFLPCNVNSMLYNYHTQYIQSLFSCSIYIYFQCFLPWKIDIIDDNYYLRSDWTLPTEAFAIRHEILDRSPPPEQFPDHHQSVSLREDTHTIQIDDQLPGMLANMQICKKPSYGPSSIVIDFLHHYATLGDVQTVACILIVLGDSRKYLTGN